MHSQDVCWDGELRCISPGGHKGQCQAGMWHLGCRSHFASLQKTGDVDFYMEFPKRLTVGISFFFFFLFFMQTKIKTGLRIFSSNTLYLGVWVQPSACFAARISSYLPTPQFPYLENGAISGALPGLRGVPGGGVRLGRGGRAEAAG